MALQQFLAAMLTACWGWLVYQTARTWLPVSVAAVVALAAGLGTQAMSTASRALWSDTWGIVMLQVVLGLIYLPVIGALRAILEKR